MLGNGHILAGDIPGSQAFALRPSLHFILAVIGVARQVANVGDVLGARYHKPRCAQQPH